jgi:hypothetical protein
MKKTNTFFCVLVLSSIFYSCNERNDLVNLTPPTDLSELLILDSSYINNTISGAQLKNVLLEDYTGVRCDNCPNAQNRANLIIGANPGRVSELAIHTTSLAVPYSGHQDFRTRNGESLVNYLGMPTSLPGGDVDRKIFAGNTSTILTYTNWQSYVSSELGLGSIVNMDIISKTYNLATRKLEIKVAAAFTQSSNKQYYMSVAITESGMKDWQITINGIDSNYAFENVMRNIILPYNGLKIADAPPKGMTYVVKFSTIIPNEWNADNCKVVAFVHQRGSGSNDVEQVKETTIK